MRFARMFAAGAAFGLAVTAFASPEQYRSGLEAFQAGDVRTAISLLRKSADQGHGPSQALLADILDRSEENELALKYYRLAADQGLPEGYFGLATMHASGEGADRDLEAARKYMTRAADAGHLLAINSMALAYMNGGLGLTEAERASPQARAWIEKAAAADSLPAIDRLATAYRRGELGLAADERKAAALETRARELRRQAAPKAEKKRPPPKPRLNG